MKARHAAAIAALLLFALAWACDDDEIVDGFDMPPTRVTDLAIDSVSATTIRLSWTAPSDDNGSVASYTLKRSGTSIDASNFSAATTVPGVPAPASPGTIEFFTVTGLDSTLTYFFALRSRDSAGQFSAVSNNANWTLHLTKSIPSYQDNTLYEEDGLCPACPGTNGVLDSLSNGAGEYVFTGQNGLGNARRALFAFAIADSLPSEATIDSVVLTLNMSRTTSGALANDLHRVLSDWGEGTSDASCCSPEEGTGGTASVGDATWLFRVFRSSAWTTPGGDFAVTPSATQNVGNVGVYRWRSAQMAGDVQGWLDSPATNFGWILIGDESANSTAKRFNARETAGTSPALTVYYTIPAP